MTDIRRSPLDAVHRELGAKMVPFGGWDMPLSYPDGTLAEHRACRHGAVVFDVSHLGTVRVSGPTWSQLVENGITPVRLTRPKVGLKPTMPHIHAGVRTEPPVSVPRAGCRLLRSQREPLRIQSHQTRILIRSG